MSFAIFRKTAGVIDPAAEEVTIYRDRVEENLYDVRGFAESQIREMIKDLPISNLERLEQVSFQLADGVTYMEDKVMCVFRDAKVFIQLYPEFSHIQNPHDDWCLNYLIKETKFESSPKFFDLDTDNYTLPELPPESEFYPHVGIGQGLDGKLLGLYFGNKNTKKVAEFFGLEAPYFDEIASYIANDELKVFGITFDKETLKVLKLKLYYYPGKSSIEDIIFDELKYLSPG